MKNIKGLLLGSVLLALLVASPLAAQQKTTADLVFLDATVYTLSASQPRAQALAVVGDRIAAVGDNEDIRSWIGSATRVIQANGLTMTPGFIESHGHLIGIGWTKKHLNLSRVRNYPELVRLVAEAARRARPGEWITGGGWHQSKWTPAAEPAVRGFPTHEALSLVSPDNPVFLAHASGHAALANAKAMEIAGVGPATDFPQGGEIIRDGAGMLTGVFVEGAQSLIAGHIPPPDAAMAAALLELAMQECLENGITSFHDAAVDRQTLALYERFEKTGSLKVRLYAMLIPGREGEDQAFLSEWFERGPRVLSAGGFLTVRAVKLFLDGALGSRGAWMLEPYSDDPDNRGQAGPADLVYQVARKALDAGFQVGVHAIGDRANREVLDIYERVFRDSPAEVGDARFRIEHAQHIAEQDVGRFARLGVVAAMQGIHMASDIGWAIDRLGPVRIAEGAYVWQKLLQEGTVIANGSDAPVEPVNPVACFYASVTRKTLDGTLYPWSHPEQRMSREQALRSYTLDAAYAAFEEQSKGSLEPGKLADLTVFSQDLMSVPEEQILDTRVRYTIVGGRLLYQR
jgi:hypothetical protein